MKKISLKDYAAVTRTQNLEEIALLAEKLSGLTVKMVNSTSMGGGVAEMLHRTVPLFNELGLKVQWDVIKGTGAFFNVTKAFHNGLHGNEVEIDDKMFEVFLDANESNASNMRFDEDIIVIHDPQPAALIKEKNKTSAKWVWRCHIDTATPNLRIWNFLQQFINKYDASIFSAPSFAKELPIPQYMIYPAIDPFADKNRDLTKQEIEDVLRKYQVPTNKPIVLQISRFDRLKDPLGIFETYKLVKKHANCRFVYAGGTADDDPEGTAVLAELQEKAAGEEDFQIILLPPFADIAVNALQRTATIVMQKSLREGFGLTVTEALWKSKPVIASAVGGIPLQIINGLTGQLVHSVEGAAYQVRYLLNNPQVAKKLGQYGKEHAREKFLLTRVIRNYLLLFIALQHPGKNIIEL
ncbi:glycosyl transferase family 1 [candidate division WOR-1 bacterium RIFOXYB2_FULL_42_35]|uniref:Glycosyl transferase family 1 n=1 Tax=candidate division WOR-1 bacterium RIFOXYC2_FULL_41_25 TaxID=1802586 RepID=A0A1F4TQZ1_UNCSA|nr:MAG: glycosyl transferase family 1 [candidate division WOR-1 bacterium RIFOXYA2_FULL_41_14]OGC25709.1 MAG: glycosyl transferase family 1 [candidate division WOR-1 bacterium RIFOXYB2_FULL_42_35]OGC35111.1 MAG: glycosyl transferase family 1 [candidate division WOR-1 bacterium RIFOXYC2_FULL_41_25]OGC41468.1 MAG: glycosyl transferase family 1 [candidate division WOR-1 bacterium RIFOXYD2_FULL_41_8]